jgi:phosphoribosylanthranilate isomerase
VPRAPRIKFCGITGLDDAQRAVDAGAWAIGLILWPGSVRACDVAEAARISARLRRTVEIAGVFVNQPLDDIAGLVEFLGLSHVQLHGDEGPAFCQAVSQRTGAKVIKAARIGHAADLRDLDRFHTDYHLLDTVAHPGAYGGTGQTWDWTLLEQRRNKIPLIVAGGLNPDNVAEAIEATHPWGVDSPAL